MTDNTMQPYATALWRESEQFAVPMSAAAVDHGDASYGENVLAVIAEYAELRRLVRDLLMVRPGSYDETVIRRALAEIVTIKETGR
jgi:hypothetical protein